MKHTPGPWVQVLNPVNDHVSEVHARNGRLVIASCGTGNEALANAKLIAAAPALLDAVKELLSDADWGNGETKETSRWASYHKLLDSLQ